MRNVYEVEVKRGKREPTEYSDFLIDDGFIDGERYVRLSDLIAGLRESGYKRLATELEKGLEVDKP